MPRPTLPGGLALAAACAIAGCAPVGDRETQAVAGADARRGRLLMSQHQCGSCHAIPGVASAQGRVAPALGEFGMRSYIAGRAPNRPDLLAQWIAKPQSLVPQTTMPDMGVPPDAARDMAAYLLEHR